MKKTDHLFVIDTNTLISAFLLPHSTARKALDKAIKTGYIALSQSTANEFAEVFIRPKFDKYLPLDIRLSIINEFTSLAIFFQPEIPIAASRDHKDDQFLELAIAAKATCIISGDKDLLVLHPFNGIPIITAAEYLHSSFI